MQREAQAGDDAGASGSVSRLVARGGRTEFDAAIQCRRGGRIEGLGRPFRCRAARRHTRRSGQNREQLASIDLIGLDAALDLQRLAAIKRQRAELAAAYFSENAAQWHRIRGLYIDEREVEAALSEVIQAAGPQDLLDIGTGTGRMLEILGPRVSHALGIDQSREMLAIARVNLERAGLPNTIVRLGDMYQLPLADASFDAVVIHQVLHYADRPEAAIAEAARVLRPNGLLTLVDFAPHAVEFLRDEHAHRRLGFADPDVEEWCRSAGLDPDSARRLPGEPLTVVIWTAHRRAVADHPRDQSLATSRPSTAPVAAPVERALG